MTLKDYLDRHHITFSDFAKQIGVSHGRTVHRYAMGERIPRRGVMARIVEVTKGKVTAADFFEALHE